MSTLSRLQPDCEVIVIEGSRGVDTLAAWGFHPFWTRGGDQEKETLQAAYLFPSAEREDFLEKLSESGISWRPTGEVQLTGKELREIARSEELSEIKNLLEPRQWVQVSRLARDLLDVAALSSGRATFYNTEEEQRDWEKEVHREMLTLNRGLYSLMLTFPGGMDRARQECLFQLLSRPMEGRETSLLSLEEEGEIMEQFSRRITPPRLFKLFLRLRKARINNSRARKLILRSILGSKKLELWSVRYFEKLRLSLEHAWGKKMTGILASVLQKPPLSWSKREEMWIGKKIDRFAPPGQIQKVRECVAFLLGREFGLTLPLLKAYIDARLELSLGEGLPYETLEGIRSQFHPHRETGEVLELTRHMLTRGQRIAFQDKAEREEVEVEINFRHYDLQRLYLYGFQKEMTEEMVSCMKEKARKLASSLPFALGRVGIVVDSSQSMEGPQTQQYRPMATALALRDVLVELAEEGEILYAGGKPDSGFGSRLMWPQGHTSLAEELVELCQSEPEVVFLISDGYENAPAGETHQVIRIMKRLGVKTSFCQISPVYAAETGGVRNLCPGEILAFPVTRPGDLEMAMVRALLEKNPAVGLKFLLHMAKPELSPAKKTLRLGMKDLKG